MLDRRYAFFLAILAACAGSPPPTTPDPSGAGAARDLRLVADFIDAAHPRPYRYVDVDTFHALRDRLATELEAIPAPNDLDVGRAIRQLLAPLRDGHLAIAQPSFQPGSGVDAGYLPIALRVLPEGVFVDGARGGLAHGARIVAIDDHPIETIVHELRELVLVDGLGDGPRDAALDRELAMLFHVRYGFADTYEIQVEESEPVIVSSVSREAAAALASGRPSAPRWVQLLSQASRMPSLSFPTNAVARLELPSFAVVDEAAYAEAVDAAFVSLASASATLGHEPALVLDLRGNEGGYRTLGAFVLGHLLPVRFDEWTSIGVRVRAIPRAFAGFVAPFPGMDLSVLGAFPRDAIDGVHRLDGDPLGPRFTPRAPAFGGRIVVLVDGLVASAASEMLAALLHHRPEVVVVGSETAGPCDAHTGEIPAVLTTPNTGIGVAISLATIELVPTRGCTPDRGVVPDVPVLAPAARVLAGEDVALERALEVAAAP